MYKESLIHIIGYLDQIRQKYNGNFCGVKEFILKNDSVTPLW